MYKDLQNPKLSREKDFLEEYLPMVLSYALSCALFDTPTCALSSQLCSLLSLMLSLKIYMSECVDVEVDKP